MNATKERADAFKVGFLFKLAKAGISPVEFFERVKNADILDPLVSGVVDVGKKGGEMAGGMGLAGLKALGLAGLALPVAAGGALGMAQSSLEAPTAKDLDTIRQAELQGLYKRLAAEVRARTEANAPVIRGRR